MADKGVVLSESEVGATIGDIQTPPQPTVSSVNIPLTDAQKSCCARTRTS